MRILTWNIHGGVGPDGRYDLDRVTAIIRKHAPDVVALQEIDSRGRTDPAAIPLAIFARAFGPHSVEARTIVAADGHYGHAIVSRWPIRDAAVHDISAGGWEPRGAIECTIEAPAGDVHLIAVHLGLDPRERVRQAAMLKAMSRSDAPVGLVVGDFNDWLWRGPVRRALTGDFPRMTGHRTFPAHWPLLTLDRIYCRPGDALTASWTDRAAAAASDHLPVIADIRTAPAPIDAGTSGRRQTPSSVTP